MMKFKLVFILVVITILVFAPVLLTRQNSSLRPTTNSEINQSIPTVGLDNPNAFLSIDNDPASKNYDGVIKGDFELIVEALNCQYKMSQKYPTTLQKSFNESCFAGKSAPYNYNTNAPFRYSTTNDGSGYILKAKLSTGEVYTISR